MSNVAVIQSSNMPASVPTSNNPFLPKTFDEAVRLADTMAKAQLVPNHLRGKPADCLLVIEQAMRWGLSPYAIAQGTSLINGKLMFEGKIVAGVINAIGNLEEALNYKYNGAGDNRVVIVSGRLKGESESRIVEVRLKDARTTNAMWTKQPDQQLAYYGARVWARRHKPELMLGVYAEDEFDAVDVTSSVTVISESAPKRADFADSDPLPHPGLEENQADTEAPAEQTEDTGTDWTAWCSQFKERVQGAKDESDFEELIAQNEDKLRQLSDENEKFHRHLIGIIQDKRDQLAGAA